MPAGNGYTPTEKRILAVLADNRPHPDGELRACLNDELACESALHVRMFELRKKLAKEGLGVTSEWVGGASYYRRVRLRDYPTPE